MTRATTERRESAAPRRVLMTLTAGLLLAMAAGPFGAQARAQDDGEDELTRVRRDQSRLVTRLPTLREKMERLAERYEDEGRTRNAVLLREALAQYDALGLLDVAREVERSLDQVGRLLDMLAVALELSHELSPRAHELLGRLRAEPTPALLAQATAAQAEVELALDKLLGRMDEWEDFQEVLSLVKTLIEDQQRLRERTESALRDERESP